MPSAVLCAIHMNYIPEILKTGITRYSSAAFLLPIPYKKKDDLLYSTLRVGCFHGVGLSVFKRAVDERITVSAALKKEGSSSIAFLSYLTNLSPEKSTLQKYIVENEFTYSYCRVRDVGPIKICGSDVNIIQLDTDLLDEYVFDSRSNSLRFFHKVDEEQHYLGFSGEVYIDLLCKKLADSILPQVYNILHGYVINE